MVVYMHVEMMTVLSSTGYFCYGSK